MILHHRMGADDTVVANLCEKAQRGIHSNKDIISDPDAMDDGPMPHGNMIPNGDVRYPGMDDTVILNTGIAPNSNSESVSS